MLLRDEVVSTVAKSRRPYPPAFRDQMVELARSGGRRRIWPGNSSPPRRPSGTGWRRRLGIPQDVVAHVAKQSRLNTSAPTRDQRTVGPQVFRRLTFVPVLSSGLFRRLVRRHWARDVVRNPYLAWPVAYVPLAGLRLVLSSVPKYLLEVVSALGGEPVPNRPNLSDDRVDLHLRHPPTTRQVCRLREVQNPPAGRPTRSAASRPRWRCGASSTSPGTEPHWSPRRQYAQHPVARMRARHPR